MTAVLRWATGVANTSSIRVFGLGDNDTITLSEVNGALPAANLFGGAGTDVLTGASGADQLFGQAGSDTLLGKGGNDAEQFTATTNGIRVRFDRVTPAPDSIDIGTSEKLVLNANGGDDRFSTTGNPAAGTDVTDVLADLATSGGRTTSSSTPPTPTMS